MNTRDILITFDTTGSMYPALGQVRRNVSKLVDRLFKDVTDIRIGIIAHGDYCDERDTYVTKRTMIQDYKEVILMNKTTGDLFNGDKAREIAGIPVGVSAEVSPEKLTDYIVFVQSTSVNRALKAGTKFLYEVTP